MTVELVGICANSSCRKQRASHRAETVSPRRQSLFAVEACGEAGMINAKDAGLGDPPL